ncbi:MAG TPA: single-stranded DNA-binding protein [Terracidiphilus sp.]|nr:single-stranded DNA-binding protein [Terracidiphilus sp.]
MALYTNTVTLKGYIGKDAQSFASRHENTFVVLSLATKSGYKDRQTNEWVNHTEWHRIVVFGKPADNAKSLKKGDYVQVEGELHSSEFDVEAGEGKKKITVKRRGWEVRASIVKKLAPPAHSEAPDAGVSTDRSSSVGCDAEPATEDSAA